MLSLLIICTSFTTPQASEQEHYWNNVDEDGQSLSECASSVFDGDLGDIPAPEPVPEKKKRPPRKKKKKKQQPPPLETTDEIGANENGTIKGENTGDKQKEDSKEKEVPKATQDEKSLKPLDGGEPDVDPSSQTQPAKPIGANEMKAELKGTPQATSENAPAKQLNPNAHAWSIPSKPVARVAKPVITPQTTQFPSAPIPKASHKPKPGSWAALAVENGAPPSRLPKPAPSSVPINDRPFRADIASSIASPNASMKSPGRYGTDPSPDWRTHTVSPRKSATKLNAIPPPPMSQHAQNAWPSLGDFPPPPGAKSVQQKAKLKKPSGAWGRAR